MHRIKGTIFQGDRVLYTFQGKHNGVINIKDETTKVFFLS